MKESSFRSRLISAFKTSHPKDFIWAMDAKFKAGFPDLYLISNGIPGHVELKVCRRLPKQLERLFSKIQLHTIGQLVAAGVKVLGIVGLVGKTGQLEQVVVKNFNERYEVARDPKEFFEEWRRLSL